MNQKHHHLSNQTFTIILVVRAEHLDPNRDFISDIYKEVKTLDDVWSEEIPDQHYVRVTFEVNLTKERDITIFPRTVSGNPSIEIRHGAGTLEAWRREKDLTQPRPPRPRPSRTRQ